MILLRNRLFRTIFFIVSLTVFLVPSMVVLANDTVVTPLVEPQVEAANATLTFGSIIIIAVIAIGLIWAYIANRNIMKLLEQQNKK